MTQTQLTLPEHDPIRNEMERKYRVWKETHGEVYALFHKFAMEMLQYKRRFGIRLVQERVRWEVRTTWAVDVDGFKVNDHYPAYIARDLIATHPELSEYLETRRVKGEEEDGAL